MTVAKSWLFAPGSFNGAAFYVETGGPEGGRRKVIHEYPGSEAWDVEDLGVKAKKITFTAYFCSETAEADYSAFVSACNQPDPGELIIPFFAAHTASAESWAPKWSQEKLNYVGVECTFIVENPANAPVALGLGERLIATAMSSLSGTIGAAVSTVFTGTSGTAWQRADAVGSLGDMQAFVQTVLQSTVLPDKTSSSAIINLATLTTSIATAVESDPGAFVTQALTVLDQITIAATPDEAAATYATAAALAVSMVPPTVTGQPDQSQGAATISVATAVAAALQAIRLIATSTYTDRPTAIAARDTIQGIAIAVLPYLGALGADVTSSFSNIWGQAVTYLSQVILNLAPILLFETNLSLPSTVLAYRLYADPARGAELVARNQVTTPLVMPTIFEAAAPST